MNDLISIVLPVYNGERFLRASIDSVVSQTYTNWELLVIDDCSTDSTAEIVREYVQKDERIKYFRNEVNLRLPRNLNRGFSLTRGNYLTWTSDDNIYMPTALEKMYSALLADPEAQFAYASCDIIDEEDNIIEYMMLYPGIEKRVVGQNPVGACFMYTRKVYETVGDYDADALYVEDFDYWQRIFMRFKVVPIYEILYSYRSQKGALTFTRKQETYARTLERVLWKNKSGFGILTLEQKYHFYAGLNYCRSFLKDEPNPYRLKFAVLKGFHFIRYRIPDKFRRIFKIERSK